MKYQLQMRIEIRQLDDHGGYMGNLGGLQIVEDVQFDADGFLEIAQILGQFHELSQKIKGSPA